MASPHGVNATEHATWCDDLTAWMSALTRWSSWPGRTLPTA